MTTFSLICAIVGFLAIAFTTLIVVILLAIQAFDRLVCQPALRREHERQLAALNTELGHLISLEARRAGRRVNGSAA